MRNTTLPPTSVSLDINEARRFLLAHQMLWPPRKLEGKEGIMAYIRHAGSIQFDPINKVGRNPDLVLQSRVKDYKPDMIEELLYNDRRLVDGWDKMAAIFPIEDWPYFSRRRAHHKKRHRNQDDLADIKPAVVEAIRANGPQSSIDLKGDERIEWYWGTPTSLARAALETLFYTGDVVVHHRVGARRIFDLAERCLPADIFYASDPNKTTQAYQDWHVLRRIGGLGLAESRSSEYWLGILGVKSVERKESLARLVEMGKLALVEIDGFPGRTFYLRTADLPALEAVRSQDRVQHGAAIIGALDNLMWDRELVNRLFDFEYVWEVYKPKARRKYGYYVLPVLYGDRFIARFDPEFDRKTKTLTVLNWWWEPNVEPDAGIKNALIDCFQDFMRYLGAFRIEPNALIGENHALNWMQDV
ncbi:MAG: YcaQ family DNA glycosylase [Anaerolineales bacterium]|nr:YcaQ family DNA glycosylase [Anaerolineales bacterium]